MVRKCHDEKYYAIVLRHSEPDTDGKAEVSEIAAVKIQKGIEIDVFHILIDKNTNVLDKSPNKNYNEGNLVSVSSKSALKRLADFMPDALDRGTPLICLSRVERTVLHHFLRDNGNEDCPEFINLLEKSNEWFGSSCLTGDEQTDCDRHGMGGGCCSDNGRRWDQNILCRYFAI